MIDSFLSPSLSLSLYLSLWFLRQFEAYDSIMIYNIIRKGTNL